MHEYCFRLVAWRTLETHCDCECIEDVTIQYHAFWFGVAFINWLFPSDIGCEFSTGPGTNESKVLVGPVKNLVYFLVKLIDYSGKLPSGPVKKYPKFAAI